jgi:uncharacterized coiled-coil protein SlyX
MSRSSTGMGGVAGRGRHLLRAGAWVFLGLFVLCGLLCLLAPLAHAADDAGGGPAAISYWPIWVSAAVNLVFGMVGALVLDAHRRAAADSREAIARLSAQIERLNERLAITREEYTPRGELRELSREVAEQTKALGGLQTDVHRLLDLMAPAAGGRRG